MLKLKLSSYVKQIQVKFQSKNIHIIVTFFEQNIEIKKNLKMNFYSTINSLQAELNNIFTKTKTSRKFHAKNTERRILSISDQGTSN